MKKKRVFLYIFFGACLLVFSFILGKALRFRASPKKLIKNQIINTNGKVLLIGVDALDWKILSQLIKQGELPTFSNLRQNGASGILASKKPLLSPIIWTTIATGRLPDEHGVLDFFYVDPQTEAVLPASSRQRKVKALWNIFSDFDKSVGVIGWLATWPAESVKGYVVSDQLSYYLFQKSIPDSSEKSKVHPDSLIKKIRPLISSPAEISYEEISKFVHIGEERYKALIREEQRYLSQENAQENPVLRLRDSLASTKTYASIASWLIKNDQPDFLAIYFEGIDTASHLFMNYAPPKLKDVAQVDYDQYKDALFHFYRYMDTIIGELIAGTEKSTTTLIISDHGFYSGDERPKSNPADFYGKGALWHREEGSIFIGGDNTCESSIEGASILDVPPTILYLCGFPTSEEMKGKPILSVISDGFRKTHSLRTIDTYENVNPISAQKLPSLELTNLESRELEKKLKALGYIAPGASGSTEATKLTNINNLGLVYFERKDHENAANEFRRALEIRSDFIDALHNLALVYLEEGKNKLAIETAVRMLGSSMTLSDDDYEFIIRIGKEVRDWSFVENLLFRIVDSYPKKAGPLIALGKLSQELNNDTQALHFYKRALSIEPSAEMPLIQVLNYIVPKGGGKEAELFLKNALDHDPQNTSLHNKLGHVYLQGHDYSLAQKEFEKALELDPDLFEPNFYLGVCYGSQGDIEKAISMFERILSNYPDDFDTLINLAASYAKTERSDKALSLFERAYQIGPKVPELLNPLAALNMQMGRIESAIKIFEESLQLFPSQPDAKLVKDFLNELRGAQKN